MFKCIVLLIELFSPLSCSRIVLYYLDILKGWLYIPGLPEKAWSVRNIRLDASSAPTKSTSVLILIFSFCFNDRDMVVTFIIVNVDPVCYLKSECTANSASTYHLNHLIFSSFNVRHNYWIPTRFFIGLSSLLRFTWLVYFTLVHKPQFWTECPVWIFCIRINP